MNKVCDLGFSLLVVVWAVRMNCCVRFGFGGSTVLVGWGIGVFFHWLQISERFSLFGSKWEKDQVEKRLGRKL